MHGAHFSGHHYTFGPVPVEDGTIFRLWAPLVADVSLRLLDPDRLIGMEREEEGWFAVRVEGVEPGQRYLFVLPDGTEVPDPASRWQPDGVLGPSALTADEFGWTDQDWRGRPWEEAVIYELHIGTFTKEGTFAAAIERLDWLVELGVTAIEILPIHSFPGRWGWGYDGVCLYAPFPAYGPPEDLRALVDAAHSRGLMVLLDVVYNHFGPQGNMMPSYMPLLSDRHEGEFGTPLNFDGENCRPVRQLVIENAFYWLEDFHFDGLRLDATHEMKDESPHHILSELSEAVQSRFDGKRHIHLVLENSDNQAHWLDGPALYTAQWDDDIHHALHVAVSGEARGFYRHLIQPFDMLARALAEGFAFQEERGGKKGEPSAHLRPTAFVSYVQNHDQVGNRPDGARITQVLNREQVRAMASVVMLSPTIPMLFMGEEWAAGSPFCYFSDLEEGLRDTVRQSRNEFLKSWEMEGVAVPDPFAASTFERSKLNWSEPAREPHAGWVEFYRSLIATRMREIAPRLNGISGHAGEAQRIGSRVIDARWLLGDGSRLRLVANLGDTPWEGEIAEAGRRIWLTGEADGHRLGAWSVHVSIIGEGQD